MDGLLVVDKPIGPTSHDVVVRVRRALRERRIGHTGTLDPAASGVLALLVGRATRLARFMAGDRKEYDATIRLGVATDTYDAQGLAVGGPFEGAFPSAQVVADALEGFRGSFLQQPPAYSAKKIGGHRSYDLARRQASTGDPSPLPAPAPVSVTNLRMTSCDGDVVTLTVACSAGFYVRSLAHDLGVRLGTGAHLTALRRTKSGAVTLDLARTLARIEENPDLAVDALVPMADMLPALPLVTLTEGGMRRSAHGGELGPADFLESLVELPVQEGDVSGPTMSRPSAAEGGAVSHPPGTLPDDDRAAITYFRLRTPDGRLLGIAAASPGSMILHPCVVLM